MQPTYLLLRSSSSAVSSAESRVSSSMAGDLDSDSCRSLVLRVFTSLAEVETLGSSLLKLSWMGSLDLRGIGAWAMGEEDDVDWDWAATAAAAASASFTCLATRIVSSNCLLMADRSIWVSLAPFCLFFGFLQFCILRLVGFLWDFVIGFAIFVVLFGLGICCIVFFLWKFRLCVIGGKNGEKEVGDG